MLAESDDTVVVEGNHYFPPESLNWQYFTGSTTHTVCRWKGVASYHTVSVDGVSNPDAAWFYPHPTPLGPQGKEPGGVLARRAGGSGLRDRRSAGAAKTEQVDVAVLGLGPAASAASSPVHARAAPPGGSPIRGGAAGHQQRDDDRDGDGADPVEPAGQPPLH